MTGKSLGRAVLRLLRHALGDIFARIYLLACAVLLVWALVETTRESSDASMAGVIPLLATAPASFVPLMLLPTGIGMFVATVVIGALANALVIGWCARALRRGRSQRPVS
ncbi:hypothetical protein AB0D14_09230 [Streptomyces sp. NPDC048484]|uniref:SCO4225 family membrane protein n=1 Tax=Streptomyces sp. NPDC048484 TaxID=3155146 RepID=UPI00343DA2BD